MSRTYYQKQITSIDSHQTTSSSQQQHSTPNKTIEKLYIASIVPSILMTYILMFTILAAGIWFAFAFKGMLQDDFAKHLADRKIANAEIVAQCWRDYMRNQCDLTGTLPAMEGVCSGWKTCMNKDPSTVLTSQEILVLLAQSINKFFEALSFKTIVGVLSSVLSLGYSIRQMVSSPKMASMDNQAHPDVQSKVPTY